MPVPENEKSPTEILNNWESVGLSEEGTFKYVLIEAYATEKAEGKQSISQNSGIGGKSVQAPKKVLI